MITINLNGENTDVPEQSDLSSLLVQLKQNNNGIALAVNQEIISQSLWPTTILKQGDQVAIFKAIVGG